MIVNADTEIESPHFGCTCARLRKLTRRITRVYDAQLAAQGIKTTQYSLMVNAAAAPRTVSDLAARMDVERTTLTRNLRALVDQGWLKLGVGRDPRTRVVSVTPSGQRKLEAAKPYWRAAQLQVEAMLGARFVGALHDQIDTALLQLPFAPPPSLESSEGKDA